MGALWVSWCVGFHVLGTLGEGEKGTSEEEGDPFSQPCHVTAGPVVGAALCVLVYGPFVRPVEDGGSGSEASLETAGGGTCLFFSPLLVSQITWEAGLGCCPPSSPSQLCDMEGVAGGHVGRDL